MVSSCTNDTSYSSFFFIYLLAEAREVAVAIQCLHKSILSMQTLQICTLATSKSGG